MLGDILQSGSNFKDAVVRALRRLDEELTQLRPVSGRGIRLRRTAAGTVIEAAGGVQTSCNTLPAAAPAAGSAYTGPFAVSYDNELGQFFVAPGWVNAIGTLTFTPRLPISASVSTSSPNLVVYLCFFWDSENEAIGYELAFRSTGPNAAINGEAVSSTIECESVAIAKIQKLADGTDTVTQYQHGPIRISGRAW